MKNYILVWDINDYPELGGGIKFDFFENISEVENKVNELSTDSRVKISFCGQLQNEIKFKPAEKVTRWVVDS